MKKKLFYQLGIYYSILLLALIVLVFIILPNILSEFSHSTAHILMLLFVILLFLFFAITYIKLSPQLTEKEDKEKINRILYELLYKSVNASNKEELYQFILESAIEAIPLSQKGCILLFDETTNLLNFVAVKGYDFNVLKNTFLELEQTYLYRESKGKINRTVMIHDPFGYDRSNFHEKNIDTILEANAENVMSTLSTPIIFNNQLHGMINIDSKYTNVFTMSDQMTIELFALEIVNVIKLYSSLEQITYISTHDQLTNIYNRNHFNEVFPKKIADAVEHKTDLTLVSIDLNNLKKANDSFGHECGDKLLIHFAKCITSELPNNSIFFRYGGDEFFLILPTMAHTEANELIENLQVLLSNNPLTMENCSIELSFCYGIATFPSEHQEMNGLIQLADVRLYEQKRLYHQSVELVNIVAK